MRRGYSGSAKLIRDEARRRAYIRDALVVPSIEFDVLARPALTNRPCCAGCLNWELFRADR